MKVAPGAFTALLLCALAGLAKADKAADYVIQVSVDGLGSGYLQSLIDQGQLPTFKRLQAEGAWTNNARPDFDYTITLPNHTCMVVCRPVKDKAASPAAINGHNWLVNTEPGDKTLHTARHEYVVSAFDVAHDNGLRTAMFASKSKFKVYDQSYDERNGAPDKTGEDNGRDKIDLYVKEGDSSKLTDRFIAEMKEKPFNYAFVHFHDTDSAGHSKKWGSEQYNTALCNVDGYLGRILEFIASDERLKGHTTIILSADHGGTGLDHFFNSNPLNYTIPFYTWGAGVSPGKELYSLNSGTRVDPQQGRPDYNCEGPQPIRNGDGGNLALMLLGLPKIPDSSINAGQDLHLHE